MAQLYPRALGFLAVDSESIYVETSGSHHQNNGGLWSVRKVSSARCRVTAMYCKDYCVFSIEWNEMNLHREGHISLSLVENSSPRLLGGTTVHNRRKTQNTLWPTTLICASNNVQERKNMALKGKIPKMHISAPLSGLLFQIRHFGD
jgi:hypothetical protein